MSVYLWVNPLVIKKYYYRRVCSVSKSVGNNIFLLPMDKDYWWKIHRHIIFVGDFVGKLITDGICILRRQKNSISKIVKSCSEFSSFKVTIQNFWEIKRKFLYFLKSL